MSFVFFFFLKRELNKLHLKRIDNNYMRNKLRQKSNIGCQKKPKTDSFFYRFLFCFFFHLLILCRSLGVSIRLGQYINSFFISSP